MKNNYCAKLVFLFVSSLLLTSCIMEMEDSSSKPEYTDVINKKFKLKEEMWALGITTDQNYKKITSYILLVPGVGFTGPEVVSRDRIKAGSVLKISKVLTAKSLFSSKIAYVIEEENSGKFSSHELRVTVYESPSGTNLGLEEKYFEKINSG